MKSPSKRSLKEDVASEINERAGVQLSGSKCFQTANGKPLMVSPM